MEKKRIVIIALITVIIACACVFICKFMNREEESEWEDIFASGDAEVYVSTDVAKSHWASMYIEYLTPREIMKSDADGNFNPDKIVTVREFLISLFKACKMRFDFENLSDEDINRILTTNKLTFSDMNLDRNVTKLDVAILFAKADMHVRNNEQNLEYVYFGDTTDLDEVSTSLISHSVSNKYIEGLAGNFYPQKVLNRAEIAKALYMFMCY